MRRIFIFSLAILGCCGQVHAEDDEIKPAVQNSSDLDREITDPKLRADSGSKSKFSASTGLSYTGGSLSMPFGQSRPDLRGLPENQTNTSLDGNLKARYRVDKNTSYTTGVVLSVRTPFQGQVTSGSQLSLGDPIVGRNYTFGAWGFQNSWDLTASYGTSYESLRIDQVASVATAYTLMKVYHNGLHASVTGTAWHNFFSSAPGQNSYTVLPHGGNYDDNRTEWEVTLFPTLEYYLSERVSVRTLFGYFSWRHLYGSKNGYSLSKLKEYQSVGMGISVTRDIYIYPNIQFLPENIRADFTNVGVSSSINIF